MKRPLIRRSFPRMENTLHCSIVKLNDELNRYIKQAKPLSISELYKFCDVIKKYAELQKLISPTDRSQKLQSQHNAFDDLTDN